MSNETQIRRFYETLSRAWGQQHWWPAQSRFEVIVGAYLTQNTSWTNVERAMANLRRAHALSVKGIREIPISELEQLVRPSGYFRQKAQRLKTFVEHLDANYQGSLGRMFAQRTDALRARLLELNGVGPETADSILLYGGNHAVFVVDAYTRRILDRHRILSLAAGYEEIRALFERALKGDSVQQRSLTKVKTSKANHRGAAHSPSRMSLAGRNEVAQVYNEMHALIVGVGKNYCLNKSPKCRACPLRRYLPTEV